jgi:hypothetical protein
VKSAFLFLALLVGSGFADGGMTASCSEHDWAEDQMKTTTWKPANLVYGKNGTPVTSGTIHFQGTTIDLSRMSELRIDPVRYSKTPWSGVLLFGPGIYLDLTRK